MTTENDAEVTRESVDAIHRAFRERFQTGDVVVANRGVSVMVWTGDTERGEFVFSASADTPQDMARGLGLKKHSSWLFGVAPTPAMIDAHAAAHTWAEQPECGEADCDDEDCERVKVGAWLVRTHHKGGTAALWHVTAWVHPDHGGGARCACIAWPDDDETLPEEFGRGRLEWITSADWHALTRDAVLCDLPARST